MSSPHRRILRRTVLDLAAHLVFTLGLAALIYAMTKNIFYAAMFISGGILIDIDHLVDYFLYFRKAFRLGDFLGLEYLRSGKIYLFMHSWEVVFIIAASGVLFKSQALVILSLGLLLHLIIDNAQRKNFLVYFLIYRFRKKFDLRVLLPEHRDILPGIYAEDRDTQAEV